MMESESASGASLSPAEDILQEPPAIEVEGLTKIYGADGGDSPIHALRAVELRVPRGEVFGLIGPNGAGKSTLMRILATLEIPTFGRARVLGEDTWTSRLRICRQIGFMPELFYLYQELRVEEYLAFFASAYDLPPAGRAKAVEDVIELTDLGVRRDSFCGSLSKGMRQRLLLAKTLLHDPELLILDEPTSGMDPQARIEFRNIIRTLSKLGKTILISSHILSDLSAFCSSVGIMEQGRMRVSGTVEEISRALALVDQVQVGFLGPPGPLLDALEEFEGASVVELRDGCVRFGFEGSEEGLARCLKTLVGCGIPITRFEHRRSDLEDIFVRVGADQVS